MIAEPQGATESAQQSADHRMATVPASGREGLSRRPAGAQLGHQDTEPLDCRLFRSYGGSLPTSSSQRGAHGSDHGHHDHCNREWPDHAQPTNRRDGDQPTEPN